MKSSTNKNVKEHRRKAEFCPFCGTLLTELIETKRGGCAFCFDVFENDIENEIVRVFDEYEYKGKVPGKAQALVPVYKTSAIAVSKLSLKEAKKRLLNIAIKEERYEDAAILRDEIKELEKSGVSEDYE